MKVVCINNWGSKLTNGKVYEASQSENIFYYDVHKYFTIINDSGQTDTLLKSRFKTMEEIREDKINQILK